MAELSLYLFWSGLVTASVSSLMYLVSLAAGVLGARRMAADTGRGTVSVAVPAERPGEGLLQLGTTLAAFAAAAFSGAVAARWAAVGHPPLSNMYEATLAFTAAMAVCYLVFERVTGQRRMGAVAMPVCAAFAGVATLFPHEIRPLVPALQNPNLLALHVSVMMVSYAVLTLAFVGAVLYLVQGGAGRRRVPALPSADAAEEFAHRAVLVGFPLLGLGIALGAWWANSAWGRYWGWDPKETSALVTWLSLAAYFHARAGTGTVANAPVIRRLLPAFIRRGPRPDPMWWIVVMWGLLLFTYFGVNLWVTGLHSYAGV